MSKRIVIVAKNSHDAVTYARSNDININASDVQVVLSPSDVRGLALQKDQIRYTSQCYANPGYREIAAALELAVIAGDNLPVKAAPMYRAVIHDADGEVIAERNLTARQVRELVG